MLQHISTVHKHDLCLKITAVTAALRESIYFLFICQENNLNKIISRRFQIANILEAIGILWSIYSSIIQTLRNVKINAVT